VVGPESKTRIQKPESCKKSLNIFANETCVNVANLHHFGTGVTNQNYPHQEIISK
jgi:hypothetical protein